MAKSTTARKSNAGPMPVYAVFGKDEFLRSRRLRSLVKELVGDADESMALSTLQGGSVSVADVLDEVRTPSMLSPLRIVCVRDADQLFVKDGDDEGTKPAPAEKSRAKGGEKPRRPSRTLTSREAMEAYIEGWSPEAVAERVKAGKPPLILTGVLVLDCKTWPKTTRLFKMVEKYGLNLNCEPPGEKDVESWVRQAAREEFGCKFAGSAAARLVELVGDNPGFLYSELSKLATYVAPRQEIGEQDINALVGETKTEIIFKLLVALTERDAPLALRQWRQVLAGGRGAEFMALGGLRFAFERLVSMKQLHDRGANAWDIKKQLNVWDPDNIVPKQLTQFTLSQVRDVLRKLLRIDVNSKTGLGGVDTSVEKLIVELCAA
ncbi:MAG TPA: DNA polymerase III subunit delta [Phycisphaerae bacterium]|nr:DNA polymerase III subunit delta [Phycisphaerae bacterium]